MKAWSRRFFALVMTLCMLVSLFPAALAAETVPQALKDANALNNMDYAYENTCKTISAAEAGGLVTAEFEKPTNGRSDRDYYAAILPEGKGASEVRYALLVNKGTKLTLSYFRDGCQSFTAMVVQSLPYGGTSAICSDVTGIVHDMASGAKTYTIQFTCTLNMADEIAKIAYFYRDHRWMKEMKFVSHIRLDPALNVNTSTLKFSSQLFDCVSSEIKTITGNETGFDIPCTLKSDWKSSDDEKNIMGKLKAQMTFTATATISSADIIKKVEEGEKFLYTVGWNTIEDIIPSANKNKKGFDDDTYHSSVFVPADVHRIALGVKDSRVPTANTGNLTLHIKGSKDKLLENARVLVTLTEVKEDETKSTAQSQVFTLYDTSNSEWKDTFTNLPFGTYRVDVNYTDGKTGRVYNATDTVIFNQNDTDATVPIWVDVNSMIDLTTTVQEGTFTATQYEDAKGELQSINGSAVSDKQNEYDTTVNPIGNVSSSGLSTAVNITETVPDKERMEVELKLYVNKLKEDAIKQGSSRDIDVSAILEKGVACCYGGGVENTDYSVLESAIPKTIEDTFLCIPTFIDVSLLRHLAYYKTDAGETEKLDHEVGPYMILKTDKYVQFTFEIPSELQQLIKDYQKTTNDIVAFRAHADSPTTGASIGVSELPRISEQSTAHEGYYVTSFTLNGVTKDYITVRTDSFSVFGFGVELTKTGGGTGGGDTPGGIGGGGTGGGGTVIESVKYPITINAGDNGTATTKPSGQAAESESVTITVSPDSGYHVGSFTVKDKSGNNVPYTDNGNGLYTFAMPAKAVIITATFLRDVADPSETGVDKMLNCDDHALYIVGYPEGDVRPLGNMTRAEVCTMYYRLLLNHDVPITRTFSDVPETAWFASAVNTMASLGIVNGDAESPDRFRPDDKITRAEFTAVSVRFGKLMGGNINFTDVSDSHWAKSVITSAAAYGWINGYEDNTFRPENKITRAEVMTIVNHILGRSADREYVDTKFSTLTQFTDLQDNTKWYFYDVIEATNSHDYTKVSSGEHWTGLRDPEYTRDKPV